MDDRRTVRVDAALWDAAKESAGAEGITVSEVIRAALAQFIDRHPTRCGLCRLPVHEGLSCGGNRIGIMQTIRPGYTYTPPRVSRDPLMSVSQAIASIMERENTK